MNETPDVVESDDADYARGYRDAQDGCAQDIYLAFVFWRKSEADFENGAMSHSSLPHRFGRERLGQLHGYRDYFENNWMKIDPRYPGLSVETVKEIEHYISGMQTKAASSLNQIAPTVPAPDSWDMTTKEDISALTDDPTIVALFEEGRQYIASAERREREKKLKRLATIPLDYISQLNEIPEGIQVSIREVVVESEVQTPDGQKVEMPEFDPEKGWKFPESYNRTGNVIKSVRRILDNTETIHDYELDESPDLRSCLARRWRELNKAPLPDCLAVPAQNNGMANKPSVIIYSTSGQKLREIPGDNLKSANLSMDLSHANLHGRDMRCANFFDADLTMADLSNANLQDANLEHAHFDGTKVEGTRLAKACLTTAYFHDVDLRPANFKDVILLSGAEFSDCQMSGVKLAQCDLTEARFCDDSDMQGMDLSGATMKGCFLCHVDLRGAKLCCADLSPSENIPTELNDVDLRGADLTGADLTGAVIHESVIVDESTILTGVKPAVVVEALERLRRKDGSNRDEDPETLDETEELGKPKRTTSGKNAPRKRGSYNDQTEQKEAFKEYLKTRQRKPRGPASAIDLFWRIRPDLKPDNPRGDTYDTLRKYYPQAWLETIEDRETR